jgi:hypothetical protein
MKILALERPGPNAAKGIPEGLLAEEALRVWVLEQEGFIREIHFRADRQEAVLGLECADPSEARRILDTLPLVREGHIDFEIIPLRAYPGFKRLFRD